MGHVLWTDDEMRALDAVLAEKDATIAELEAELATLRQELARYIRLYEAFCPECSGTGMVDSGGVEPWGAPIDIRCPRCAGTGCFVPLESEDCNAQ